MCDSVRGTICVIMCVKVGTVCVMCLRERFHQIVIAFYNN